MNLNNTSSGKQYNNVGSGSQYNAENITIHHATNDSGDKDRQFLIDLKLSDPRLDKEDIENTKGGLLKDSYLWILNNEAFQRWRADFRNRLLWIRGDPGKGKTMLLCGIVDELHKEKSTHQPIYFFCQATDSNLNTASAVLRGILYLMLKKKPQLIKDLREAHDHSDRRLFEGSNGWNALCDMVIRVLAHESFQNAVIVIDALDECTAGVDKLLDFIHVLSSKAVRIIISSRNWPSIERGIASAAQQAAQVSLELNEHSISTAVMAFIDHKVNQLAQKHEYSATTRDLVYNTLVQNSNSTFLWAALVCQQLADNNLNTWDVESKLAEFPPGLDVLYTQMLHQALRSTNVGLVQRILAVASVVFRPVEIAELRSLLGPLGSICNDPRSLEKAVRQCGSFLTVRNDTVYFVHQSAKEFLLEHTAIQKVMLGGLIHEHVLIGMNSLQVISKTLRRNMYNLKTSDALVDDIQPPIPDPLAPIRYSCVHWIDHLCKTSGIEQYQADQVVYFFERSFLHWAEAICLLGNFHEGVRSIHKLSCALKDTGGFSDLAALVQDALLFLQRQRDVIEKTPLQIYCSVLLFSPKKSLIRGLHLREVPDWILTKPLVHAEGWDTSLQLIGHHGRCQTIMFSLDGDSLVSTSLEDMKLWDAKTGGCLRTIRPSDGRLGQVTLSNDGQSVAAVVGDFKCKIWSVETGECLQTFKHHSGKIKSIALSQNGRTLAMGSEDMTIRLWNIETGMCLWGKPGHNAPVAVVAFSPDGCTLASGASSIMIWDMETGAYLRNVQPDFGSELCSIFYTSGGRRIASVSLLHSETCIQVWETSTGDCLLRKCFAAKLCGSVEIGAARTSVSASSRNDGMIVYPTFERTIEVWDLGKCEHLSTIVRPHRFAGISISSDGERLAIVSDQGIVLLRSLTNLLHQPPMVSDQTIMPTSLASLVSRTLNWKHATPSDSVPPTTGSVLPTADPAASNTLILAAHFTSTGCEFSVTTQTTQDPIPPNTQDPAQPIGPNPICGVEFSIHWDFTRFHVWPRLKLRRTQDTYEPIGLLSITRTGSESVISRPIQSINLSVDGQRAISVHQGQNIIDIWNARSGRCLESFSFSRHGHHNPRSSMGAKQPSATIAAFTREQQILLATTNGSDVEIWNATKRKCLSAITADTIRGKIIGMSFSGDATRLAISSYSPKHSAERNIQIWCSDANQCAWNLSFKDVVEAPSRNVLVANILEFPSQTSQPSQTSFTQWFSQSGSELHTSYGTINLMRTTATMAGSTCDAVPNSTPRGYHVEGQWIMRDSIKMVWLPEEYRPWNGAFVARGSMLAIGCESGHAIFFEFSKAIVV